MPVDPNPYAPPQIQALPPQIPLEMIPPGARQYAPCPTCGNGYAKPVGFTLWGGILGPKLLTHVKCVKCQTAYNGKTGKSNNTAIAIYVLVTAGLGLAVGIAFTMA